MVSEQIKLLVQGDTGVRGPGLCRPTSFAMTHELPNSAWADGIMAELAGQQGKQSQIQPKCHPVVEFVSFPKPVQFFRKDSLRVLNKSKVRAGGVQGNQIHSNTQWPLGIPKM